MKFGAACSKLPRIGLVIVTTSLGACATGGSEPGGWACPAVPHYPADFQAQAADEIGALPTGSAIEAMLVDYAVMRSQARACAA